MRVNAQQFKHELDAAFRTFMEKDVPDARRQIALDIRQGCEDRTRIGATGKLRNSWMAGTSIEEKRQTGSHAEAAAALARIGPEDTVFVYATDFRIYFHEFGVPHHPAFPMLGPTLVALGDSEVKL